MKDAARARIRLGADAASIGAACQFVERFAADHRVAGADLARILIVVEELVTNVAKYGYAPGAGPGFIDIRARFANGRLALVLIDDGASFDPFAAAAPDLDASVDESRIGGLGLPIVKAWMDRTRYRRAGRYNVVAISRAVVQAG